MKTSGPGLEPKHRSVRVLVDHLVRELAARVGGELPREELVLWGEVLEQRVRGGTRHLQLLDSQQDDTALEATVPATAGEPAIGEMVALAGRLTALSEGDSIRVVFAATRIDGNRGKSKRRAELERLLEALRAGGVAPRKVGRARKVVLVSSEGSRAVSDFKLILARERQVSIECELQPVKLTDPTSISRGVHAAAESPEVDLIVVTRGGGSAVDLMPFNAPEVVTAIAEVAARVPVVTALGHHADATASDLVSSHVEATPTSAGHFVRSQARRGWLAPSLLRRAASQMKMLTPQPSTRARQEAASRRVRAFLTRAIVTGALIGIGWCGGVLHASRSSSGSQGPASATPRASPDSPPPTRVTPRPRP